MRNRRYYRLISMLVLGLLVLSVAACGGKKDDKSSSDDSKTTEQAGGDGAQTNDSSGESEGDGASDSGASSDICSLASGEGALFASGDMFAGDIEKNYKAFSNLVDNLPTELKDTKSAFTRLQNLYGALISLSDDLGIDINDLANGDISPAVAAQFADHPEFAQKMQEYAAQAAQLNVGEVESAISELEKYVSSNC